MSASPPDSQKRTIPPLLDWLFQPVSVVAGVGTHTAKSLVRVAGPEIVDLLWHLPFGLIDRRYTPKIAEIKQAGIVTVEIAVDAHFPGQRGRPYRVRVRDETGFMELIFFNVRGPYLQKQLPVGEKRLIS